MPLELPETAHARTAFRLMVGLPYEDAFPLFGAWAEQKWAADWKPEFVYPDPPSDREGSVFRVHSGWGFSIWITTLFDIAAGRIQYVNVLNGAVVTRIDLAVTRAGKDATHVAVVYERTALDAVANDTVRGLEKLDQRAGPEWQAELDGYVRGVKGGEMR